MEFFQKDTLIVVVVVTIIFLIKKLMVTKKLEKIEVDDELKEKLNKLVTYFTPKWENYNNEWHIIYTEHKWEFPLKSKPKFHDNTENFKDLLNRIAILADKIDF